MHSLSNLGNRGQNVGGAVQSRNKEPRLCSAEGAKEESLRVLPTLVLKELSLYKYRDLMLTTALFLHEHEKASSISVGR